MVASAKVVEPIDQTEVAMMLVGPDHTITYANGSAHDLLGYEHGALHGLSLRWLSPPSRHGELQNLDAVFAGQGMRRIRSAALRSDGSRIDVAMKLEPCRDEDGKVVAASVTYEQLAPGSSLIVSQPPSSMQPRMSQAPRISQRPPTPSSPARSSAAPANATPSARAPSHSSARPPSPPRSGAPVSTPVAAPATRVPSARPANTQSTPPENRSSSGVTARAPGSVRPSASPAPSVFSRAPESVRPTPAARTRPPAPPSSAGALSRSTSPSNTQTPRASASLPPAKSAAPARATSSAPPSAGATPVPGHDPSWVTASLASRRPQMTARGLQPASSPPNEDSAPPQSGSRPIAPTPRLAGGTATGKQAFIDIREQLESALQLMGWLEGKFAPGQTAQLSDRERMHALVVVRDVQALLQDSKAAADQEIGPVEIPKAPKLPRV